MSSNAAGGECNDRRGEAPGREAARGGHDDEALAPRGAAGRAMTAAGLALTAAALAAACATPGPATTALVARVLRHGPASAPSFCAGLLIGDLLWLACAALGGAALAQTHRPLLWALRYAGAAYLLYLAARQLAARAAPPDEAE